MYPRFVFAWHLVSCFTRSKIKNRFWIGEDTKNDDIPYGVCPVLRKFCGLGFCLFNTEGIDHESGQSSNFWLLRAVYFVSGEMYYTGSDLLYDNVSRQQTVKKKRISDWISLLIDWMMVIIIFKIGEKKTTKKQKKNVSDKYYLVVVFFSRCSTFQNPFGLCKELQLLPACRRATCLPFFFYVLTWSLAGWE